MRLAVLALAVVLVSSSAAHAESAPPRLAASGLQLALEGTSTVRDFSCKASKSKLQVGGNELSEAPLLEQFAKAMRAVKLDVAVKDLDCANGTMNDHMRTALRAEEFSSIKFAMKRYEVGQPSGDVLPLKVEGDLTLLDKTLPVTMEAKATIAADGSVRIEGSYPLKMTDWGVKPPRLMLGTMKVGEVVKVKFDVALKQK